MDGIPPKNVYVIRFTQNEITALIALNGENCENP